MFDKLKKGGSKKMLKSKAQDLKEKAIEKEYDDAVNLADDVIEAVDNDDATVAISKFQELLEVFEEYEGSSD